jgi:hypothetical protein
MTGKLSKMCMMFSLLLEILSTANLDKVTFSKYYVINLFSCQEDYYFLYNDNMEVWIMTMTCDRVITREVRSDSGVSQTSFYRGQGDGGVALWTPVLRGAEMLPEQKVVKLIESLGIVGFGFTILW